MHEEIVYTICVKWEAEMTFYYYFHGDNPHFGVIKLFINIELTTRDIWSGHDVTNETRRKLKIVL